MDEHPHQVHAQLPAAAADYAVSLQARGHRFVSDEPPDKGGHDAGARPFELALAGLASCTAITIRMYAQRKQWPLGDVEVGVSLLKKDTGFANRVSGVLEEIVYLGAHTTYRVRLDDQTTVRVSRQDDGRPERQEELRRGARVLIGWDPSA